MELDKSAVRTGPPAMVVDVRSDATRIRALGRGSSEAGHPKFWASGRDVRGGPAPENGRSEARHPKEDPHVTPSQVRFPPRSTVLHRVDHCFPS
jgi:hypothetical protein